MVKVPYIYTRGKRPVYLMKIDIEICMIMRAHKSDNIEFVAVVVVVVVRDYLTHGNTRAIT